MPALLYADWKKYAEAGGEAAGTSIAFGKKMAKRGLGTKIINSVRRHVGVELKAPFVGGYDVG